MNDFKGWFSAFAWMILVVAFAVCVVGTVSKNAMPPMMSSGID